MRPILIALLMTLTTHTAAETFEGKEAEMLIRKGKVLASMPFVEVGMQLLVEENGRLYLCALNGDMAFGANMMPTVSGSLKVKCINSTE